MRNFLSAVIFVAGTATAQSQTVFGQTVAITQPVGTMFSVNVQSTGTSTFSGSFRQSFSFNQTIKSPTPIIVQSQTFNFNGNSNFMIRNQVMNNIQTFVSPGFNFNW